ncbi:LOW QUALITY PROTEIN: hypothetical protein YC2023_123978 [Brassica napus]
MIEQRNFQGRSHQTGKEMNNVKRSSAIEQLKDQKISIVCIRAEDRVGMSSLKLAKRFLNRRLYDPMQRAGLIGIKHQRLVSWNMSALNFHQHPIHTHHHDL